MPTRAIRSDVFAVEAVCGDAREFVFPTGPLVVYLFNPLTEAGIEDVVANLAQSLRQYPRAVYLLYRNPSLEHVSRGIRSFARLRVRSNIQFSKLRPTDGSKIRSDLD